MERGHTFGRLIGLGIIGLFVLASVPAGAYFTWDVDQTVSCSKSASGYSASGQAKGHVEGHYHDVNGQYYAKGELKLDTRYSDEDQAAWPLDTVAHADVSATADGLRQNDQVWADAEIEANAVLRALAKDPGRKTDTCGGTNLSGTVSEPDVFLHIIVDPESDCKIVVDTNQFYVSCP